MDCINCTWSKANHSHSIASALTCGDFVAARNARQAPVVDPDRCGKCKEAFTPRVTKGSYKCKCDQPKPPRHILAAAEGVPLSGQVRYGGR